MIFTLVACDNSLTSSGERNQPVQKKSTSLAYDAKRYTQGLQLYQQHCSSCHGKQAEGAIQWHQKNAQGQFPPPPLNGTGHTWHHSYALLVKIIKEGTSATGGNMPAWQGRLSDQQIDDILYWVQSQWDKEIYEAWQSTNQ